MEPTNFKESNMNLGAGNNPNTGDLQIAVCSNVELAGNNNIIHAVSAWKPTEEELAEINRTGIIYIAQMGWPQAPICAMGLNPFENHHYKPLVKITTELGTVYLEEGQPYCKRCALPTEQKELDQFGGFCMECNVLPKS